ncbi:unnamed protein product [Rotaria socialis]|uniref:EGF-like domain-containing protein n=1 Tax=Rotaria socialis TaxID=392032 RepID=A0A820E706_9BILA|nr:unnamed protein product [Rotaria socialis]
MSKVTAKFGAGVIEVKRIGQISRLGRKFKRSVSKKTRVIALTHDESVSQHGQSIVSGEQYSKTRSLTTGCIAAGQPDHVQVTHVKIIPKPKNAITLNNIATVFTPLASPLRHVPSGSLAESEIKLKKWNPSHELQTSKYKTPVNNQGRAVFQYDRSSKWNVTKGEPYSLLPSWSSAGTDFKSNKELSLQTATSTQRDKRKKPEKSTNTKQQKDKRRRKLFKCCCCLCSPLCLILSILGALLAAATVTGLIVILFVSNVSKSVSTTTTTTSTSTTTTTTSTITYLCNPTCLNGGTCMSNNSCMCIANVWTGSVCETPVRILWTFDNTLDDFYGIFPAVGSNGPTYKSPGINGYGSCLYLNASASQSIDVLSPPFLSMAYTSFSLSAWIKATTLNNAAVNGLSDNGIFGQYEQNSQDLSLHTIVRNQRLYFGFYGDDTQGNQLLVSDTWYHVAYVYDYSTLTQNVYVDGVLDGSNSPRGPYKGTVGNMTIGTNEVFFPYNYWNGCLDQISYFSRVKNATEVLYDATLTVAYSFNNTLLDDGPMGINGTGINFAYTASGRISTGLTLLTTVSYVQAGGLVLLGTSTRPYSMSIWINPTVITSGNIIHVAPTTTSISWSVPMLGFINTGNLGAQGCSPSGSVSLTGPVVPTGTWTHVAITYGNSNGLRLWINGTQFGASSSAYNYTAPGVPVTVTLGASLSSAGPCSSGVIATGQYHGSLDEFQLHSRELSSTDIWNLANP